ncbi:MAG: hypothetical protein IKL79_05685 [Clostridia bacterium]|nr:hypothetical protein [Clostridia bacterium]MBR3681475.1 hypothetical protein [Clostridia bacterium]
MGFGTLFIGYFLLLNIVKPAASDVIAGLVILLALERLSQVNRKFKLSRIFAALFSAVGLVRFVMFFGGMLIPSLGAAESMTSPYFGAARFLLLCPLTVLILLGIEEVAREVELEKVPTRAKFLAFFGIAVRLLYALCSLPVALPALLYFSAFLLEFIYVITLLFLIWNCYYMICMPGEENGKRKKPSRFAFVNAYREREEQKEREMQEYRLAELKRKQAKRKGKKKKK